jgi:fatty acid desaturase
MTEKEINKKAVIKTTKVLLYLISPIGLVYLLCCLFPSFTEIITLGSVLLLIIIFLWSMIFIAVEQDIRNGRY